MKFAAVAALALAAVAHAAPPVSAFGPGEQATYAVSYLGVVAGEAQITVGLQMRQFDTDVWPILCIAKTVPSFTVFPVSDRYISFWDPANQRNAGSDFFIDEGKKKRRERVQLKHADGKAMVMKQDEGEKPRNLTFDIDQTSVDMAGASFYLRNEKLVIGSVHERPVFTGTVTFQIRAEVLGKQTLKTVMGEREVYKVKVSTEFSGQLKTKRDMTVYFTADAVQIPVRVEADFLVGQMVAELVRYEPGRDLTKG